MKWGKKEKEHVGGQSKSDEKSWGERTFGCILSFFMKLFHSFWSWNIANVGNVGGSDGKVQQTASRSSDRRN